MSDDVALLGVTGYGGHFERQAGGMEKVKAKEKVRYADKLDDVHRRRYLEKLAVINGFDPYKSNERDWSTDPNKLPPLAFGDLHNYVVLGKSAYTANEFKKEHFGFCLERCGFFINHQMPYLGASPDGIVSCECCGKGCLEVKCPYKYKDSKISDGFPDKTFCLYELNGQTALKKTSPYYYQVQCQILVTQTDFCDFVVWTSSDFAVVHIEPDAAMQETIKQKASAFCKSVALPEMVAKYFTVHACGTSRKLEPASKKTHIA